MKHRVYDIVAFGLTS